MPKSDLKQVMLVSAGLMIMLSGLVILGQNGIAEASIDPAVEKACYDEVKQRAPLGYRSIITYGYQEEGSRLGIVIGGLEAQYAPDQWTQVEWTCRVDPTSHDVARIELSATNGKGRMKAAASAFQ